MLMSKRGRVARLHYLANDFRILVSGDYVVCAESGEPITLDRLRYWSVARQEPYASAEAAMKAMFG